MRTLTVANVAEFNQANVRGRHTPGDWAMWRRAGDELADMAAFWGGSHAVALVPEGHDAGWLADVNRALGWEVQAVCPARRTGRLVDDALADPSFMTALAELLAGTPVRIEPWGTTASVLRLTDCLRCMGIDARLNAPVPGRLWAVPYLDSKLSLNDLAGRVPGLRVPRFHVAVDFPQLMGMAEMLSERGVPFVVKANVGVGGFGMYAATDPDGLEATRTTEQLMAAIDEEPIFREGPYLVQEWIAAAPDVLRPTFDGVVHGPGDVEVVGVGGMLIDGCTYHGVMVGDLPLDPAVIRECSRLGEGVGHAAADLGFRGWFDVDFVLDEQEKLYATEINARRTSPTHAFCIRERLRELSLNVECVVADDHLPLPEGFSGGWPLVREALDLGPDVHCLATIVRTLDGPRPSIGAVVGAADHASALSALSELRRRLAGGRDSACAGHWSTRSRPLRT